MENRITLKKSIATHGVSIIIMLLLSILVCYPVLQGKVIKQDDIIKHKAQSKEIWDYREANGEEPLWTSKVFSGMPTTFISTVISSDVSRMIYVAIKEAMPETVEKIFLLQLGFYILLIVLGVNPWLALVGAIGYGLSSNLIVSIVAGHNTKVFAIAYVAPALAGVLLSYRGKKISGALLVLLATTLLLKSSHYQIIYYFLIMCAVIGVVYGIDAIKSKRIPDFLKTTGLVIITGLIAVAPNSGSIYSVLENTDETIRGNSTELKTSNKKEGKGLDKEYAMRWSYGPLETLTTIVPSFQGGASTETLSDNSEVASTLKKFNLTSKQQKQILSYAPTYTGEQPFILGTVYFGAAIVFLFVFALFYLQGSIRIISIALVLISLFISWGRHFEVFTGFLFDYLPMYNKFRTPSMALAIAGLIIPFMGFYGLFQALTQKNDERFAKSLKYSLMTIGGVLVLILLYGLSSDWVGANDAQVQARQPWSVPEIYAALLEDRKSLFLTDWFLSTLVLLITAGVIWMLSKKKLSMQLGMVILGIAIFGDMWRVSSRYLNTDSFITEKSYQAAFTPSVVDNAILRDKDPNYRVINLSVNPWTDGPTCYHHKNVGGHHAAKLQRYQDLIERQLSPELQKLNGLIAQGPNGVSVSAGNLATIPALNMLNTKYLIFQPNQQGGYATNPNACGNAWFINQVKWVTNDEEEISSLQGLNPKQTAVINEEFKEFLGSEVSYKKAPNASIELTSFSPKEISYTSNNNENGLAVFSEVYYTKGWKAYIDNEEVPISRANYVLRALEVPAGKHEIVMRFEPDWFSTAWTLSLVGSILFLIYAGGLIFVRYKNNSEAIEA